MEYIICWQTIKDYKGNTEEHFEISENKKYLVLVQKCFLCNLRLD